MTTTTLASKKKAEEMSSSLQKENANESPEEGTRGRRTERKSSFASRLKPQGGGASASDARHEQRERSESRHRDQRYRERERDYRGGGDREYRHRASEHKSRGSPSRERDRDRDGERRYSRSNSIQHRGHHMRSPEKDDRRSCSRSRAAEDEQMRRSRSRQRSDDRNRDRSGSRNRPGGKDVVTSGASTHNKDSLNLRNQNHVGLERGSRKKSSSSDTGLIPFVVQGQKTQRSDYKVREIWLGNLPENISRQILYSHFFICGEIEEIEILKQTKGNPLYAFIRFKLTSCTKRAYDTAQALEIDGYKVKVQFSDCNRRGMAIVGDVSDYDLTPANCTTLFIAFSVGLQLPDQNTFQTVFQKYGRVRAVWMKQTESNTKYRPHAFVDYFNIEDAQKARREMYDEDQFGQKRSELGDKSCEILFAIKKRNKDFSHQSQSRQGDFNNMMGQNSMMGQRPQFGGQPPQFHQMGGHRSMSHLLQQSQPHQHPHQLGAGFPQHNMNHSFHALAAGGAPMPHQQQQQHFAQLHLTSQTSQPSQPHVPLSMGGPGANPQGPLFGAGGQSLFGFPGQQAPQHHMHRTNSLVSDSHHQSSSAVTQLPPQNPTQSNPTSLSQSQQQHLQSQPGLVGQPSQQPQQPQQYHPMVRQILSLPQLQNMRQQNPEIAAKLESAIQMNPDPKNIAFVLQAIIQDHKIQQTNQTQHNQPGLPPPAQSPARLTQPESVPNIVSLAEAHMTQAAPQPQLPFRQPPHFEPASGSSFNEHSYESQHSSFQAQGSERGALPQHMKQSKTVPPGIRNIHLQQPPPQQQTTQPPMNASGYFSPNPANGGVGGPPPPGQQHPTQGHLQAQQPSHGQPGFNQHLQVPVGSGGAIFDQNMRQNQPSNFSNTAAAAAAGGMMTSPQHAHPSMQSSPVPPSMAAFAQGGGTMGPPPGLQGQFGALLDKQNTIAQATPVKQVGFGSAATGAGHVRDANNNQDSHASFSIVDFIKKQKKTADEEESSQSLAAALDGNAERAADDVIRTEPVNLFDDDEKSIWSGFVTRNKQFRVCMMAYTVVGENNEQYLPDRLYNLNVSLRANFEDVDKFESQGVVAFVPQGDTYETQFQEYIDYFNNKQRVGVAFLDKGIMFLLPPSDLSRKYFTSDRPHMVGIFGDQQAAAAQSAQFGRQGSGQAGMIRQSQEMGSKM